MADSSPDEIPRKIYSGDDADARLARMGLSVATLHGAAEDGDEGRQQWTLYHPQQSKGHRMWSDTVAGLRRRCIALNAGWRIDRTGNFETVASAGNRMFVAVVGGDEFTGWRGHKAPRVRRKRGPETTRRVELNMKYGMQPLPLQGDSSPVPDEADTSTAGSETWFFLIRATDDWLYMELSRPIGLNGTGYVADWSERILLPQLPITGGVTPIDDDDDDDDDGTTGSMAKPRN
jgi:hypothetical protein